MCVCVCVCVCARARAMLGLWITIGKTLIKNSKIKCPDKIFIETEGRQRLRKSSRSLIHRIITILEWSFWCGSGCHIFGQRRGYFTYLWELPSLHSDIPTEMGTGNEGTVTSMCVMKIFCLVCVCSFCGSCIICLGCHTNYRRLDGLNHRHLFFAQLRKLKVHDLGACKSTSGEDLSGLPEGPLFTGPSHGLLSKHQHLCYLFLSLKDINHVGLRFDS